MANDKIRVAMLRCDWHAYTYGPLMAPVDVDFYRNAFHEEYFFMINCNDGQKLRTPMAEGFEITKVWDYDSAKAQGVSDLFFGKPEVCADPEDMVDDIDAAFINCCNGVGEDHLKLAEPFLKRGIPTFVDKPFSNNVKDARAMVKLSRDYGAPLFSGSILTYVNEVAYLQNRFPELHGKKRLGVIKGAASSPDWENLGAIIHSIALALGVFGWGVESVECMGRTQLENILLHYPDSLDVMIMNFGGWTGFSCDVYSDQNFNPPYNYHIRSNPILDYEFLNGALNILEMFKKMVETGVSPVTGEQLIEKIAIVEAARIAQKLRREVALTEV